MFKDPKVQGAVIAFVFFLIITAGLAVFDVPLRQQLEVFVFGAMTASWGALLLFIKPDGGIPKKDDASDAGGETK